VLAAVSIRQILAASGGIPSVPLDDSYIHFQFARSFADGHPFVYSPGTPAVAGATSLLWPALLALPWLLGAHGSALIPWAWGFGFAALGLLAYEAARAAEELVEPELAWFAGVTVLAFSANTWFAASGMEVVPLAWLLLRATRRAAEWLEGDRSRVWELVALGLLGPALRPEGAVATLLIVFALGLRGTRGERGLACLTVLGLALPALVFLFFTGHATQTTTQVKWLPLNPYLSTNALLRTVLDNLQTFLVALLNGELWSAAYVPEHSRYVALLALPALVLAGQVRRAGFRSLVLVLLGLGILLPTTYDSFLWNRLRYLWPFAAPWLIGLVALADQLGELAALITPRLGLVRYLLCAALGAALVSKFPFALEDLADSSRAITEQHVALGQWARQALPSDARIGVNDTGAVAYFSGHQTFDIVGLTTQDEARYWVAGAGSRFEHYEHLGVARLPTHFIVYPAWLGTRQLLGTCLEERTVYATILGGETMVACHADYSVLGSGERAASPEFWHVEPLDALDVADLESESAHGYQVLPASSQDDVVLSNGVASDGVRRHRKLDTFTLRVAPRARLVLRLGADSLTRVSVALNGSPLREFSVAATSFEEHTVELPEDTAVGTATVNVTATHDTFNAAHYWLYPPIGP